MIDLNSQEFDGRTIFNDGTAGVVEGVTIDVTRKDPGDHPNAPDYRLVFKDPRNKATIDKGLYYVDETAEKAADRVRGLGSELKHIWGAMFGKKEIPKFDSPKEMLDGMFAAFREEINQNPSATYRVTVDYGNERYPQRYLRVQTYPPYLESTNVPKVESRLALRSNACTQPLVPDSKEESYEDVHDGGEAQADTKAWD